MKLRLLLLTSAIMVCMFMPSCEKKGGVEIKVNLPRDFSAVVRRTVERKSSLTVLGKKHSKSRKITDEYLIECLDIDDDGVMAVKQTYKSCKVSGYGTAGEGKLGDFYEYDMSTVSDDVPGTVRFHAAGLGESLTIWISPGGETVEVEGVEAFADKMMSEMRGLDESQGELTRERFIESLESSRVAGLLGEYPRRAKSVGESWKIDRDTSGPSKLGKRVGNKKSKYRLESVTDGVASLKKESTFESTVTEDHSGLSGTGVEAEFTLKKGGTSSSEIEVDLATGVVLSSRSVGKSALKKHGPMTLRQRMAKSEMAYKTMRTVETIIR